MNLARYLVLEMGLCAVLPLLEHLRQLIQATMVKMEDLVLTLPACNNQLSAGAGLIAVGQNKQGEQPTFISQNKERPSRKGRHQMTERGKQSQRSCPFKWGRNHFTALDVAIVTRGLLQVHFLKELHLCLATSTLPPHQGITFCLPQRTKKKNNTKNLSQQH